MSTPEIRVRRRLTLAHFHTGPAQLHAELAACQRRSKTRSLKPRDLDVFIDALGILVAGIVDIGSGPDVLVGEMFLNPPHRQRGPTTMIRVGGGRVTVFRTEVRPSVHATMTAYMGASIHLNEANTEALRNRGWKRGHLWAPREVFDLLRQHTDPQGHRQDSST